MCEKNELDGARVTEILAGLGWSDKEASVQLCVSDSTVRAWRHSKCKGPAAILLELLERQPTVLDESEDLRAQRDTALAVSRELEAEVGARAERERELSTELEALHAELAQINEAAEVRETGMGKQLKQATTTLAAQQRRIRLLEQHLQSAAVQQRGLRESLAIQTEVRASLEAQVTSLKTKVADLRAMLGIAGVAAVGGLVGAIFSGGSKDDGGDEAQLS